MQSRRCHPPLHATPAPRPTADGAPRLRFRWVGTLVGAFALLAFTGCTAVSEDDEDNATAPMMGRLRPAPRAAGGVEGTTPVR